MEKAGLGSSKAPIFLASSQGRREEGRKEGRVRLGLGLRELGKGDDAEEIAAAWCACYRSAVGHRVQEVFKAATAALGERPPR